MGRSSDYEVEKLDFRESAALLTDGRSAGGCFKTCVKSDSFAYALCEKCAVVVR